MKLVLGSNGQLGQCLQMLWKDEDVLYCSRKELDITQSEKVYEFIKINNVDTVINCSAYTNVELAETEQSLCDLINHVSVGNLGKICQELNAYLIHVSTDYVFSGKQNKPIFENEKTEPLNVYGRSKLLGEIALEKTDAVIVRTSWLYSEFGKNFVKTISNKLKTEKEIFVVNDQKGSPTYAINLAEVLIELSKEKKLKGIYHFANKGEITWFEFAQKINEIQGTDCQVLPVSSKKFAAVAQRPVYTVLNTSKIEKDLKINIPSWEEGLKTCLGKIF